MSAHKRILTARTALVLEAPFFGALVLRLKLEADPQLNPPTAATDGARILYVPEFVESLQAPELQGLLAHEVLHVACGHPWRRDGRDSKRWNIACDIAINPTLRDAGFQLPARGLFPAMFGLPEGMGAEWYYDRLPASLPEEQPGGVLDAPADDDAPSEGDWQEATQQAAAMAEARGDLPAGLKRFAERAAAPRIDWRAVLHRFFQASAKADYSWRRPSARYAAHGMYLPALRSEAMGRIAVAVDVSGSVDDVLLAQFSSELDAIVRELSPEALDVIYCDASIQKREEYLPGDTVQLSSCGGGGTDFRPVFEELREDPPVCLVYLTDLYGTFPPDAPEFPTLWGATSNAQAPFGELVRMM